MNKLVCNSSTMSNVFRIFDFFEFKNSQTYSFHYKVTEFYIVYSYVHSYIHMYCRCKNKVTHAMRTGISKLFRLTSLFVDKNSLPNILPSLANFYLLLFSYIFPYLIHFLLFLPALKHFLHTLSRMRLASFYAALH